MAEQTVRESLLPASVGEAQTSPAIEPDAPPPEAPRSRRNVIAAGLAGLAGLVLGSLGRPLGADAAAGGSLVMGAANNAGTSSTSLTTNSAGTALLVTQTGAGTALRGSATALNGVAGFFTSANGPGVSGVTADKDKYGVYGANDAATHGTGAALRVSGEQNDGVVATTASTSAIAVKAQNAAVGTTPGQGPAVLGLASKGTAADIESMGFWRAAGEFSGPNGVIGATSSDTTNGYGVIGTAASTSGTGVYGVAGGTEGQGIYGWASSTTGITTGVLGVADSSDGTGVHGYAGSSTGTTYGVHGYAQSPDGYGVYGEAMSYGAYGKADGSSGIGTFGWASASTGTTHGVYGEADSSAGTGVSGWASASTGTTYGVYGKSDSSAGVGVYGYASYAGVGGTVHGVFGYASPLHGYAVYGQGNGAVSGNFSKAGGSFKIDHPLDPADRYLLHSFVESPDMMNVYNGIATLDAKGEATVELPDWFEALNRDFRYQLTAIGSSAPDLYVKSKVNANAFSIGGGKAGQEVSWMLTGIRQDAWANAHRIEVEVDKPADEKGLYLHPAEHGQPDSKGLPHPAPVAAPAGPTTAPGMRKTG